MTEKEILQQEINQIIEEHSRKRSRRRRNWIICGGAALLLLVIILGFSMAGGSGQKLAGPYESIAGTYEIDEVDVLDMFEFPSYYYDMGNCTIQDDGKIQFCCYDGEAEGNGEFIELQGTVRRCSYTTHDYEIEVSGGKYHNVLLDVLDGQIRIHVPSTYKGGANSTWRREIDYYYRPVVDK